MRRPYLIFLPAPETPVLNESATEKITVVLSKDTLAFFREKAQELGAPYQRMIRNLLDAYAAQQRGHWNGRVSVSQEVSWPAINVRLHVRARIADGGYTRAAEARRLRRPIVEDYQTRRVLNFRGLFLFPRVSTSGFSLLVQAIPVQHRWNISIPISAVAALWVIGGCTLKQIVGNVCGTRGRVLPYQIRAKKASSTMSDDMDQSASCV